MQAATGFRHTSAHLEHGAARRRCWAPDSTHIARPALCPAAAAAPNPWHALGQGHLATCCHAAKKAQQAAPAPGEPARSTQPAAQQDPSEDEDGFFDYEGDDGTDEFEFEEYEEGEEGEFGDADDDGFLLGLEQDDTKPGVDTSGMGWAEKALAAARRVLSAPVMSNLELYVFRALPGNKLDIRLDRLDDTYGSPTLDDIEKFSRMMFIELEAEMGVDAAGDISMEVSSPGAERTLRLPGDLQRFAGLPLYVEYTDAQGEQVTSVLVMDSQDSETGVSLWRLADVKANAPGKGRKLSKRKREMVIEIPVSSLRLARVHVDM